MQAFKAQGIWWLPESPESRVYGSLSCNEAGELRVSLLGHLVGSWMSGRRVCPVLLGAIRKDAGGMEVTLFDCIVTNTTISSGLVGETEELFAHRGYFGAHLPTESAWAFARAEVCYSGLSSWAHSLSGFITSGPIFTAEWKSPEPIVGEMRGGSVLFGVGCKSSGTERERSLIESVGLVLNFKPPLPAAVIEADYIFPLQNFFTFATDSANAVSRLDLTAFQAQDSFEVIGARTFSDDEAATDLTDLKMLFTLDDISGRLPTTLQTWLDLHKRHSAAFSVYFGGLYKPPGYTDLRFSLLMQAITLYVATQSERPFEAENPELNPELIGKATDHVSDLLAIHPLLTGKQSVAALLADCEEFFAPLLGNEGKRRTADFLEYVTATHRYTITRQPPGDPHAGGGADLYWLCERLSFLFKISLLRDLGFNPDQVRRVLYRNRTYAHLRDSPGSPAGWHVPRRP